MFSKACSIARNFTFPFIISTQNIVGQCHAGLGAFVLINNQGWCVSANHIFLELQKFDASYKQYLQAMAQQKAIENNSFMPLAEKETALKNIKLPAETISNYSVWLGHDSWVFDQPFSLPEVDLLVFKIANFVPTESHTYPIFKKINETTFQGTSLCKMGFPFHEIKPTFEPSRGFVLPEGSVPVPLFPIDGIYTRSVNVKHEGSFSFPLKYIETSTPGLKGQSGGPTFDVDGKLWAIQSQTQHLNLGFGTSNTKPHEAVHLQHQYLNVGWGIHADTIMGFLDKIGVAYSQESDIVS